VPRKAATRRSAVILTALDVETQAVLRQLRRRGEKTIDGTVFYRGRFEDWDIAVAECGPGNTSAAAIAQIGIAGFQPRVALFVGVAGGLKDAKIGDVVVADKVYRYESGKEDEKGVRPRPNVRNSSHVIEQRGRTLPKSEDWKKRLNPDLPHDSPKVFVGPIASGERVVATADGPTAVHLREQYGDTLAVEMEGGGFLEAADINALVSAGVVRGISDLLSGKTAADQSGSQELAADAASAASFEILHGLAPPPKRGPKPGKKPSKHSKRKAAPSKKAFDTSVAKLPNVAIVEAQELPAFLETPTTFSKAVYFQSREVLARIGVPDVDEVLFSYFTPPDAYLRIIPITPFDAPLKIADLQEAASQAPMLKKRPGALVSLNGYGVIAYDPARAHRGGPAPLNWATQLFPNGELWAMSNTLIIRERESRPEWVPVPLLPAFVFEEVFYNTVHAAVAFATAHLGLTLPCRMEFGLLNIKSLRLGVTTEDIRGPIHAEDAVCRLILPSADREAINMALLQFFEQVYDLSGFRRAIGHYGFPPGPPRP
jgi:nucleoside phosphorylase